MTLVHPDEKKKFEFKLVSLDKQGELERTTVFPPSSKWYRHPTSKLFLIRMMEYHPVKERFVPCPIEVGMPTWAAYTEHGPEPRDWIGYTFNGWGSADMNPLLAAEKPGSENGSDSEGAPDLTGFEPEDLVGQYNTPGGGELASSDFTGPEGAPRGRQARQPQFTSDGRFDMGSAPPSVDERYSVPTRSTVGAVRLPRVRAGKEPAVMDETRNRNDPMAEYQTEASSHYKYEISNHYKDLASLQFDNAPDDTTDDLKSFGLSGASSVDTDEFELRRKPVEKHLGTGIELSARPPPKIASNYGDFSDRIVEPKETQPLTTRTVRQPRERKPRSANGAADESSNLLEKESVSEVDTRKFQRTMRQKAPSRKKLYDGNDESQRFCAR